MRILVLSDSHGHVAAMERAVALSQPDHILHLGDCLRDADALCRRFPALPLTAVPGNCDYGACEEPEKLIELGGQRIFLLHGHTRGVKHGIDRARYAAEEVGAQILLFGHTHCPLVDFDGSVHILNPGTAGGIHHAATYGVITIGEGGVSCATYCL